MILEVITKSSEQKDMDELREQYFEAGVSEYWLADARQKPVVFEILARAKDEIGEGFLAASPNMHGWVRSRVFEREFRLTQTQDPLGHPQFTLEHRD
jgi:Uma2 family endonuclease